MDPRAERIGLNEALFRDVNERVKEIQTELGDVPTSLEFVCECGHENCAERLRLTVEEYEHVRADPATFAIRPGHEIPDVESVVETFDDYVVVKKHAGDPEAVARATAPR